MGDDFGLDIYVVDGCRLGVPKRRERVVLDDHVDLVSSEVGDAAVRKYVLHVLAYLVLHHILVDLVLH